MHLKGARTCCIVSAVWVQNKVHIPILDGQNRQSPIASVQRALFDNSRRPFCNSMRSECCTNERQSRDPNRSTNLCVLGVFGEDMTTVRTNTSDLNRGGSSR